MIDHFWQKVFLRYIILAKHHFAIFIFIYHFRGWFSYFGVYHFATQLYFLSTACIILQLNFGFFQSILKDICDRKVLHYECMSQPLHKPSA